LNSFVECLFLSFFFYLNSRVIGLKKLIPPTGVQKERTEEGGANMKVARRGGNVASLTRQALEAEKTDGGDK
jgi:hypothetical protein